MKIYSYVLMASFSLALYSCGKKNVPTKTNTTIAQNHHKKKPSQAEIAARQAAIQDSLRQLRVADSLAAAESDSTDTEAETATSSRFSKVTLAVDSRGELHVSESDNLPADVKSLQGLRGLRSFTPAEYGRLKARFGSIPPRAIYVPEKYARKTSRGYYYILKKRFWYWKKDDGFYYLDQNYYN